MVEALEKLHEIESSLNKKLVNSEILITMHRSDTDWYYKITIHYKHNTLQLEYTLTERTLAHLTVNELYMLLLNAIKGDILRRFIK